MRTGCTCGWIRALGRRDVESSQKRRTRRSRCAAGMCPVLLWASANDGGTPRSPPPGTPESE
eukprot:1833638-Prymnesium_polylepis.1